MTNDTVTIRNDDIELLVSHSAGKDLTDSQEMAAGFEAGSGCVWQHYGRVSAHKGKPDSAR